MTDHVHPCTTCDREPWCDDPTCQLSRHEGAVYHGEDRPCADHRERSPESAADGCPTCGMSAWCTCPSPEREASAAAQRAERERKDRERRAEALAVVEALRWAFGVATLATAYRPPSAAREAHIAIGDRLLAEALERAK